MIPVSMVVYWMMILWLKQSDTCVNGGLLNDDTLIKKVIPVSMVVYWMMIFWLKQSDTWKIKQSEPVSIVVYWMMIFWLKQMCQLWFIEWWYFD